MPAVVLVVDRRPGMALYPDDLPWLHKPAALRAVAQLLIHSAMHQRALVGYLDFATHGGETESGTAFWRAPRADGNPWQPALLDGVDTFLRDSFDAPDDDIALALEFLTTRRSNVPLGSFVFVLSDFIERPPLDAWALATARGWDVVPVIVQDPVWEQSFPEIDGVLITLADARDGEPRRVRLGRRAVAERRRANEERLVALRADLVRLDLEPVIIGSSDPADVHATFLDWAHDRLAVARGAR
jgi:hypothetical protein